MAKVLILSSEFPAYHQKAGEPTYFPQMICSFMVEKGIMDCNDNPFPLSLLKGKGHTIRMGHRWKAGDFFSPRIWSGKPYRSKMITLGPDIEVKKVWDFDIVPSILDKKKADFFLNRSVITELEKLEQICENDGLSYADFLRWFKYPKRFSGQIVCWDETISY